LSSLAKPSLFLGGRARFRKALRQIHHFFGEGREKISLRKVRTRRNLTHSHLPHPLRSSRNGSDDRPLDYEDCDQNDQKHLRDYVPKSFAPDARALCFHVTGVVVDCEEAGQRSFLMKRQKEDPRFLAA
jgi:hypothetical protein